MTDWHVFMWQSLEILNIFNTLTLKQIFWKTQIPFTKPEDHFLVESTEIDNATIPYKTALSEANVKTNRMGSRKWNITKNRVVLPVIFFFEDFSTSFFFRQVIFFWKFCLSSEPCIKSCFWCTNYPNVPVHTFQKRFGFIWGCFFPVSHCVKKCLYSEFSGSYFPAFGLKTERYSVSLCIQSECGKILTRITPNTDTFYAVSILNSDTNWTSLILFIVLYISLRYIYIARKIILE